MTTPEVREQEEREGRAADGAPAGAGAAGPPLTWRKLTVLPTALVVVLLATLAGFRQAHLDLGSQDALSRGQVLRALWQHVELTTAATALVLLIALPLGVLLTRDACRRTCSRVLPAASAIAALGRGTPAIGLLALLVLWFGAGRTAALAGIVVCAVLPVLSQTVTGLRAGDPRLLEAARGIGMSPLRVLTRVELPLAAPTILAGVRTALVLNVGTTTLAAFGGGGGLGVLITTGIARHHMPVLLLGSILTVALALLVDWMASVAELLARPWFAKGDPRAS
ncbi:ABC transporter permease [Streptomyces sp. NPDC048664]|uniref:ABC transporter permease n=1 Tax=Streptomyces sp. NPDC048664 TaxID=3154505 RepID=UPI00342DD064